MKKIYILLFTIMLMTGLFSCENFLTNPFAEMEFTEEANSGSITIELPDTTTFLQSLPAQAGSRGQRAIIVPRTFNFRIYNSEGTLVKELLGKNAENFDSQIKGIPFGSNYTLNVEMYHPDHPSVVVLSGTSEPFTVGIDANGVIVPLLPAHPVVLDTSNTTSATPITLNQLNTYDYSSCNEAWYSFTAQQTISFFSVDCTDAASPYIVIFDDQGSSITQIIPPGMYTGNFGEIKTLFFETEVDELYYFAILPISLDSTEIDVTVNVGQGNIITVDGNETTTPNNTPENATPLTTSNELSASIHFTGTSLTGDFASDTDFYSFTAQAGNTYEMVLTPDASFGILPEASLYDAEGSSLSIETISSPHQTIIRYTCTAGGTCYLETSSPDEGMVFGNYRLALTEYENGSPVLMLSGMTAQTGKTAYFEICDGSGVPVATASGLVVSDGSLSLTPKDSEENDWTGSGLFSVDLWIDGDENESISGGDLLGSKSVLLYNGATAAFTASDLLEEPYPDSYESGTTPESAENPVVVSTGDTLTRTLHRSEETPDIDYFKLNASADTTYRFTVESGFLPLMSYTLTDEEGNSLGSGDAVSLPDITPEIDGIYHLTLSLSIGSCRYTLTLEEVTNNVPEPEESFYSFAISNFGNALGKTVSFAIYADSNRTDQVAEAEGTIAASLVIPAVSTAPEGGYWDGDNNGYYISAFIDMDASGSLNSGDYSYYDHPYYIGPGDQKALNLRDFTLIDSYEAGAGDNTAENATSLMVGQGQFHTLNNPVHSEHDSDYFTSTLEADTWYRLRIPKSGNIYYSLEISGESLNDSHSSYSIDYLFKTELGGEYSLSVTDYPFFDVQRGAYLISLEEGTSGTPSLVVDENRLNSYQGNDVVLEIFTATDDPFSQTPLATATGIAAQEDLNLIPLNTSGTPWEGLGTYQFLCYIDLDSDGAFTDGEPSLLQKRAFSSGMQLVFDTSFEFRHLPDSDEPDDERSLADTLEIDTPQTHTLHFTGSNQTVMEGDIDYFVFTAEADTLYMLTGTSEGNIPLRGYQYDSVDTTSYSDAYTSSSDGPLEYMWTSSDAGDYYFSMEENQYYKDSVRYTLEMEEVLPGTPVLNFEADDFSSFSGENALFNILDSTESDYTVSPLAAGSIGVSGMDFTITPQTSEGIDWSGLGYYQLLVIIDKDGDGSLSSGDSFAIEYFNAYDGSEPSIDISYYDWLVLIAPDSYEENDTRETATPISVGESQSHTLHSGDVDNLTFSAVSGTSYTVTLDSGYSINTDLYLRDSAENTLDNTWGYTPSIDYTAAETGSLYIEVVPWSGSGSYTITLTEN